MKDDLEFNIKFVTLIEQYKALYDHTNEGNSNRIIQEQAWREIADAMEENWMTCKEKWKNIRSCYTRHLRQKANDKVKKPYYLSKHLHFLLPFCRSIAPTGAAPPFSSPSQAVLWSKIEIDDNDELEEDPLTFDNKEEEVNAEQVYFTSEDTAKDMSEEAKMKKEEDTHVDTSTSVSSRWRNKRRKLAFSSNRHNLHYPAFKKSNHNDSEDPDLNFFKSLLPDVRCMTSKQKNMLKIKVLSEIDKILYGADRDN